MMLTFDRTQAFKRQLAEWAGRPGVPFLALPGVKPPPGGCLSCGGEITHRQAHDEGAYACLRCDLCVDAVNAVLEVPSA